MSLEHEVLRKTATKINVRSAVETQHLIGLLLLKLHANKAGTDGKRAYTASHNPAVREIAGGIEVLTAVLEGLAGNNDHLHLLVQLINEE